MFCKHNLLRKAPREPKRRPQCVLLRNIPWALKTVCSQANRNFVGGILPLFWEAHWDLDTIEYTVKTAIYDLCGQRPPGFYYQIPCMDDFVQKSLCGERLPAQGT